jgi:hypothetical protein
MAWADRLYMVSYLSVDGGGDGTGLYEIDANLTMKMIANHSSCYANRILHPDTNQIVIGRWVVTATRQVFEIGGDVGSTRLGAVAIHLQYPTTHIYLIGMDGELFESNISTTLDGVAPSSTKVADMVTELEIPDGEQPHFKAAHSVFPPKESGLPAVSEVTCLLSLLIICLTSFASLARLVRILAHSLMSLTQLSSARSHLQFSPLLCQSLTHLAHSLTHFAHLLTHLSRSFSPRLSRTRSST